MATLLLTKLTSSIAAPLLAWHESFISIRGPRRHLSLFFAAALFSLGVIASLAGCGLFPRKKTLPVQAFIVTNDRDNVTLGLLSIYAAPADSVYECFNTHLQSVDAATADFRKEMRLLERDRATLVDERSHLHGELEKLTLQRSTADLIASLLKAPVDEFDLPGGLDAARRAVAVAADQALEQSQRSGDADDAKQHFEEFERLNGLASKINDLAADARDTSKPVDVTLSDLRVFFSGDAMRDFPDEREYVRRAVSRIDEMIGDHEQAALHARIDALSLDIEGKEARMSKIGREESMIVSRLSSLREKVADAESLDELWNVLPAPAAHKKTDPDGVALFELDSRSAWILWAKTERKVGGHDERYYWIVKAPRSAEWKPQERFFLSNDNQLRSILDLRALAGMPERDAGDAAGGNVPQ
jgi:hypothetical protein